MSSSKIIVRFSPSPTGFLHIGSLRTALFNYLFAKHNKGSFFLRIEDTDQARFVEGATEQIISSLKAYGIAPDNLEHLVFQSSRLNIYKEHADKLVAAGNAYECFCTPDRLEKLRAGQLEARQSPKYDRFCLHLSDEEKQKFRDNGVVPVIRLKIPEGKTFFKDLIFGEIKVENETLDDQVLLKSDGFPTYHLANVVDDHETKASHVIRGEEWIPSTPKHIILYKMFGWDPPQFAHLPLIVKPDHKKLSKRDQAADAQLYLKHFETEAILNHIALLGWNPKTEQEIFTLPELAENFSPEKVNRAPAVFDEQKLQWVNKQWIAKKGIEKSRFFEIIRDLAAKAGGENVNPGFENKLAAMILQRAQDFWQIEKLFAEEFLFFFTEPEYDASLLVWKDAAPEKIKNNLMKLLEFFSSLAEQGNDQADLEQVTKKFLKEQGIGTGEALWPLRVALTGLKASPGPFEIMVAFAQLSDGKEIVVRRIQKAIEKLSK